MATRDLAAILRHYRVVTGTAQAQLAALLDIDRTYLSAIENGRRTITSAPELRRIAGRVGIPAHTLGITDERDTDYRDLLAFAESTLRLANLARNTGNPTHAITEIWPLIQRLETRVTHNSAEPEVLMVLAQARTQLGICLGDILPEQQLNISAEWTGRALYITTHLGDPALHTTALRAHGNELRKGGHTTAAIRRLQHAADLRQQPETLIALARAAGESGNQPLFNDTITALHTALDKRPHHALVNELVCWEVHVRGLTQTQQHDRLPTLINNIPHVTDAAPQWKIIAAITTAAALHTMGNTDTSEILTDAIADAQHHRLPHQIQRATRTASIHHPDIAANGRSAIKAFSASQQLALPPCGQISQASP